MMKFGAIEQTLQNDGVWRLGGQRGGLATASRNDQHGSEQGEESSS